MRNGSQREQKTREKAQKEQRNGHNHIFLRKLDCGNITYNKEQVRELGIWWVFLHHFVLPCGAADGTQDLEYVSQALYC